MDDGLPPSRTALLAVCCVVIALLALTEQFVGLLVAVPTFLTAAWVFHWEQRPGATNRRVDGVSPGHG
jgi:hypothetical protein